MASRRKSQRGAAQTRVTIGQPALATSTPMIVSLA